MLSCQINQHFTTIQLLTCARLCYHMRYKEEAKNSSRLESEPWMRAKRRLRAKANEKFHNGE